MIAQSRTSIVDWIRGLSVGRKLMLIYVFGIFVPLVVANGLVLRSVLRDTEEQQVAFLFSTIENIEHTIRREFEPIELVSEFVFADTTIYRILQPGLRRVRGVRRGAPDLPRRGADKVRQRLSIL